MGNTASRIGNIVGKGVDVLHKVNPFLRKTHETIAQISDTFPQHKFGGVGHSIHDGLGKARNFTQKVWHLGQKLEQTYNFTTALGRLFTTPRQPEPENIFQNSQDEFQDFYN